MKLTRIEVFNFRKLRRARLDMSDRQTLLVGANNSGKTSAMNPHFPSKALISLS